MSNPNDEQEIDELEGNELEGEENDDVSGEADDSDSEESTAKVDTELDEAETDADREAIREQRKAQRRSKAQRHREKSDALERNLQALAAQNQALQSQVATIQDVNTSSQIAQVDSAIEQANSAAEHFKSVIAQATAKGDGKTVADATEYMIAARTRANELSSFKNNATRAMNAPKPLNQALVSKAQQFLGSNKWYGGPQSNDPDSKVLTALDNSLTAEGWDATTDAYWSELEVRAKKYLPHRLGGQVAKPTRSPVSGASGAAAPKGTSFQLSAERVNALKSAGLWDDVTQRNKAIAQYRAYDKSNRS